MVCARVEVPKRTWSLEKLKSWLQAASRKWALDAFYVGLALSYARPQLKQERLWMEFCRDACPGYSYETVLRWVRLAESVKDPSTLDGIGLTRAYELTGIVQPKKTRATPDKPRGDTDREPPAPGTPAMPSAGADDVTTTSKASGKTSAPGMPDRADETGSLPDDRRKERRPGITLSFFTSKVMEQLTELERLPKKERWKDLDLEEVRANLTELQARITHALKELPKNSRRMAS